MAQERPKAERGRNPVLDKAKQSQDWLQAGFGDFFEAAEQYNLPEGGVPLGEAFDAGVTAALTRARASQQLGPSQERKEAAHRERQEARTAEAKPTDRAAAGLVQDEQDEQADERAKQAAALVAGWDEDDIAAIEDALADRIVARAPKPLTLEQDDDEDEEDAWEWNPAAELAQAEELAEHDGLEEQAPYALPGEGDAA